MFVFICCVVDFENQPISGDLLVSSPFRTKLIDYVKLELEDLRQIDNIIKELLKLDDNFNYDRDVGIKPIQFLEKYEKLDLEFEGQSFELPRTILKKLSTQFRIFYVIECTIFVPILAAPKWMKGIIREKDFEMQICAPGFSVDDKKFQLEILEFDSEPSEKLREMVNGRLLVLYIPLNQIN